MHPALDLPQHVEEAVVAALFDRARHPDPDAAVALVVVEWPRLRAPIERLVAYLREQLRNMEERLGLVWQLSRYEGRYEMLEEVGRGGLGTVSIARDRLLGRRVAYKTIHPQHGQRLHEIDPAKVHRFLDEAQIMGQLRHPGIPLVHDLGIGLGGVPFYTMRYVRGRTLEQQLTRGDRGAQRRTLDVLELMQRIAAPIAHAHSRGVIHRDIKPANILIGSFDEVAVIDWGLAQATASGDRTPGESRVRINRKVDLHSQSHKLGSPGYTAPEQIDGTYVPASDIYSLCAVLHEMLFDMAPRLIAPDGRAELPGSRRGLDAGLLETCRRGLEPQLERRYTSVDELLQDWSELAAGAQRRSGWSRLFGLGWIRPRPRRTRPPAKAAAAPGQTAPLEPARPTAQDPTTALAMSIVTEFPGLRPPGSRSPGRPARPSRETFVRERLRELASLGTPEGRFKELELLGQGGMGKVRRCQDELLGRAVAVKTLRAGIERDDMVARLLDEAQIAAQLDHPAVLGVHEVGIDENGQLRIVMPWVEGGSSLHDLRSEAGAERPLRLLLHAAWGLAFAHRKGVIHRDVKPSNILLGKHDDAYLADWGLALVTGSSEPSGSRIQLRRGTSDSAEEVAENLSDEDDLDSRFGMMTTRHGHIVGTPMYMPPEALLGDVHYVSTRSDVWSLGMTLSEVALGEHPLHGVFDNMSALLHTMHSVDPFERVARRLPRHIRAVCRIALESKPERRFADAAEFARALADALR